MTLTQSIQDSLKQLQALALNGHTEDNSPHKVADVDDVNGSLDGKDYSTLAKVGYDGVTNKYVDDKTYLMEGIVQVAADLPTDSVRSQTLTHKFLNQLWTDLEHPPQTYLGKDYVYRKADGSNNNTLWPQIGRAGQPYARSVKATKMQPIARPDPGIVFDSILKRKQWEPHPNRISSVLFYVASVIIHDLFHTSHNDFNISDTSSYLDLSPLYGSNAEQQGKMRTGKDGKLHPDCFSDARVLGFPPGVGLLLIFFNRFHNEAVDKIAQIDENERFSRIRSSPVQLNGHNGEVEYDEALFQTGRLITTGLYINIILQDYVRTILNLNRTNSKWDLDPRSEKGKALFGSKIPMATGNQVSAEFNLVYRWHSTVSERDVAWTEQLLTQIPIKKKRGKEPSVEEFLEGLREWAHNIPSDPSKRTFEGLKRDETTGLFADDDLAKIWTESVEDIAGSFGANRVPQVLKMVEILGILQSRTWNLASLNEFRKFFKLQPHKTFADINSDPEVQEQLKRLYGHPDNVELYPGVVVESAKEPKFPGSGLCANFTISRAILSDAVALVRGDRFYTVDYTPQNLTNWGFHIANYDSDIDDGAVFYKLVLNALPNHYARNSVYAHFPMTIPSENAKILRGLGKGDLYDCSTPRRRTSVKYIRSYRGCKAFFEKAVASASVLSIAPYSVIPNHRTAQVDSKVNGETLTMLHRCLSTNPKRNYAVTDFQEVDIIHHVGNLAQVHFAACLFALPLKTDSHPDGALDAEHLWHTLTALYSSLHINDDPGASFRAQVAIQGAVEKLGGYVVKNIKSTHLDKHGWIGWATNMTHQQLSGDLTDQSTHLIQEMSKTGAEAEDLTYNYLLPAAATIVVSQARAFADCLSFILPKTDEDDHSILEKLQHFAAMDTEEADSLIEKIVLEALRMRSRVLVYATPSSELKIADERGSTVIAAYEPVAIDVHAANHDATVFADAETYKPELDAKIYLPGTANLPPIFPGRDLSRPALVGMIKAVMRLPNLRRAIGPIGDMKSICSHDGTSVYLNREESEANAYPSSMKVNFGHESCGV